MLKFKGKGKSVGHKIGDLYVKLVNKMKGERKENDFYTSEKISIADVRQSLKCRQCWVVTSKSTRSSEASTFRFLELLSMDRLSH